MIRPAAAAIPSPVTEPLSIIVIGGGAAGFFAAITAAEAHPGCRVLLLEHSHRLLAKVRISGGGRCNVTHAGFDPAQLVQHYPRGGAELRGPSTRFGPRDTVDWFAARGVPLKTEADGRMFPDIPHNQELGEFQSCMSCGSCATSKFAKGQRHVKLCSS